MIVGVVTAIVVLILSEPIKALLKKIGVGLGRLFDRLGWRFRKRCSASGVKKDGFDRAVPGFGYASNPRSFPQRCQGIFAR